MANKKIHEAGKNTQFSSTNQPAKNGRKPKLYTIAKKTYNISYDEWKEVVIFLIQSTKKEIEAIASDETTPIWITNVCKALQKDTGKGSLSALKELTEKLWGKPLQETKSQVDMGGEWVEALKSLTDNYDNINE